MTIVDFHVLQGIFLPQARTPAHLVRQVTSVLRTVTLLNARARQEHMEVKKAKASVFFAPNTPIRSHPDQ